MKTAEYKVPMKRGEMKFTRYGKVTLKDDGKISFSIPGSRGYSYASNELVRAMGRKIVESDFNHPNITSLLIEDDSRSLVSLLLENTQEVRKEFVEQTRIHSESYWVRQVELNRRTNEEWFKAYDIAEDFVGEKWLKLGYKTPAYKEYMQTRGLMGQARTEAKMVSMQPQGDYVANQIKLAEEHYKNSISKLASRLNKKGITVDNVKEIKNGKVKQNFECYIYHGDTMTIAYTIIASGPIQRPHYRYLLK